MAIDVDQAFIEERAQSLLMSPQTQETSLHLMGYWTARQVIRVCQEHLDDEVPGNTTSLWSLFPGVLKKARDEDKKGSPHV